MREIILDTETTGLLPAKGDRIVEIGCLEMIDKKLTGNNFHSYIQPCRSMNEHAFKVHGLSDAFLSDKPRFKDIYKDFLKFIAYDRLIIHNAQFDIGFLNYELTWILKESMPGSRPYYLQQENHEVFCTKQYAENKYGKGGNKLDELCDKFSIDREHRTLHGALKDCELLAEVYLRLIENDGK